MVTLTAEAVVPAWTFSSDRIGNALVEGGWSIERSLGVVEGSPEFGFPLQLVYLTTRPQRGFFGDQWFMPQLESYVLPRGDQELVWQSPDGKRELLTFSSKAKVFRDTTGAWTATVERGDVVIDHAERWQYRYHEGKLMTVASPTGRLLEFGEDAVTLRDPQSGSRQRLVRWKTDRNGYISDLEIGGVRHRFKYDSGRDGRLLGWITPGGAYDYFQYGKRGVLITATHGFQQAAGSGVSGKKEPPQTETVGFTSRYYAPVDARGRRVSQSDTRNAVANYRLTGDSTWRYEYDDGRRSIRFGRAEASRSITAIGKSGERLSWSVDLRQGVETRRSVAGSTLRKWYHRAPGKPWNHKIRQIEQDGVILAAFDYDQGTGLLTHRRDRSGVTAFEYPPAAAKHPETAKPLRIWRETGGERGKVAEYEYDKQGRLVAARDRAGRTTRVEYDERGQTAAVTGADGQRSELHYDAFGRPERVQRGDFSEALQRDGLGRITQKRNADGTQDAFRYGPQGGVSEVLKNGVTVTKLERDANGLVASQTDALGRTTKYERDLRGRLLAEIKPNGIATRYEYDERGRRTAQTDGKGNRIEFQHNPSGQLIRQENPIGQILTWDYNSAGQLLTRTNGVQRVTHTYDEKDRLAEIRYQTLNPPGRVGVPPAGSGVSPESSPPQYIRYQYDERGRLETAATPTITVNYFRDDLGRITAQQMIRGTAERVIRYTWSARDQKTSVTLAEKTGRVGVSPAGAGVSPGPSPAKYTLLQQTEYAYNDLGQLAKITGNGRPLCEYAYNAQGRLSARRYGNGMLAQYGYDDFGRQTLMKLDRGPLLAPLTLQYKWDAAGQVVARAWNKETQTYEYEPGGQLTKVWAIAHDDLQKVASSSEPASQKKLIESYAYDPAGNITQKQEGDLATTMTYDPANQLVSSTVLPIDQQPSSTNFSYDPAGRLKSEIPAPSSAPSTITNQPSTRSYGYLDKVLALEKPDSPTVTFDYYPDGQLAAKSSPPINHQLLALNFTWDGLALLARDGQTFAIEPHISGGSVIASVPDPTAIPAYCVNDILGTTLAVITPDRVEIVPLTAFGKPRGAEPATTAEPGELAVPKPLSTSDKLSSEHEALTTSTPAAVATDRRQTKK